MESEEKQGRRKFFVGNETIAKEEILASSIEREEEPKTQITQKLENFIPKKNIKKNDKEKNKIRYLVEFNGNTEEKFLLKLLSEEAKLTTGNLLVELVKNEAKRKKISINIQH